MNNTTTISDRHQLETICAVTLPDAISSQQWGQVMDLISTALNLAWNAPEVDPTQGYFREAMLRARALASSGAQAGMWMSTGDRRDLEDALHVSIEDAFDILLEG